MQRELTAAGITCHGGRTQDWDNQGSKVNSGTLTMIGGAITLSNLGSTITLNGGNPFNGSLPQLNVPIYLGTGSPGTLILIGPQGQQVYGGADYLTTYGSVYQQLIALGYTVPPP